MYEDSDTPDIVGAKDALHQYRRCPPTKDWEEKEEEADFFLDVTTYVQKYLNGVDDVEDTVPVVSSGRTQYRYDIEEIEEVLEHERANPRFEDGVPYLLSALDALNKYQGKDDSPEYPVDEDIEPVDSSLLQKR